MEKEGVVPSMLGEYSYSTVLDVNTGNGRDLALKYEELK